MPYILEKFYPANFNPQQYWDNRYAQEHIAGKSSDEFRKQGFWPILERYLEKGKKYLDVGCGIGGWVIFLKEEGYNVEGIDTAAQTVRALTEYDPEVKVTVASMTKIPYADASLDGLLIIGNLEYLQNKIPEALNEVHRVLKDGGWVFLEVPIANWIRRLFYLPLKRLERIIKMSQGQSPTFANYLFIPGELPKQLEQQGFMVTEIAPHDLPEAKSHYGLYIDWPILRGRQPYELNILGQLLKSLTNTISPWIASTGMVIVARKK